MIQTNFFTGEPVDTGSPQFLSPEQEAARNASFGMYNYNPEYRQQYSPGMQGYYYGGNQQPIYQQQYPPMYSTYPQQGLGSYPAYGSTANPAINYMQQNYGFVNTMNPLQSPFSTQQNQDVMFFIKPVNFSSEYLPSEGVEEKIEQLQQEYYMKQQEQVAEDIVARKNNGYMYGGYNYYGMPYYNPYRFASIDNEIQQEINNILDEARENRKKLNLHLSRLCHNYLGDEYDDNTLVEIYNGKQVKIPGFATQIDIYNYNRWNNMVPYDDSAYYREQDAAISKEHNDVISPNSNMQEWLENIGVLAAQYEMEEEMHRRRDMGGGYNSDGYKYLTIRKSIERKAREQGIALTEEQIVSNTQARLNEYKNSLLDQFPTLKESARLSDDGTLTISCNFGSMKGSDYSVHNSQEAEYQKQRERLQRFTATIDGASANRARAEGRYIL